MVRALIADIDAVEAEAEEAPEVGTDMIPFMIPTPVYAKLSDAAAKQGLTVAQLIGKALAIAIEGG